jgi:GH43 family beta-xylosidase
VSGGAPREAGPGGRRAAAPSAWPLSYRPIYPEAADQGDPFLLAAPPGHAWRYYVYVTSDLTTELVLPAYGSNDLVHWRKLGPVLAADAVPRAYWAPCVRYVPGLRRPFVMLYSRSLRAGAEAHIGHQIRRADAERPDGAFEDSGHVLTPDSDFAIDPDVYRLGDGRLRLAYATDFAHDAPIGTGLVECEVSEDLTRALSPPRVLARAAEPWQVYDPERRMPWKPIPGVDWTTQTVRWHCLEGPVGGLSSPDGRAVYLYSGGCFFGFYAVGALIEDDTGRLVNVTREDRGWVLRPQPEHGFFGPGHCAWFRGPDGREWLVVHARFGAPDAPRQATLVELRWSALGLPYCVAMV